MFAVEQATISRPTRTFCIFMKERNRG
uniref:Uncharacterized protein n=1 Tax=Zea mays TaxID=4577 RepID=B4FEX0_MAIZE|nr:unknown [Zea mays]ACR37090.1 unknown [Zea mays]